MVDDKIPVPEYLWKLVVDTKTGESIVFVTLNNPFIRYATRSNDLCSDVCDVTKWSRVLKTRANTRKVILASDWLRPGHVTLILASEWSILIILISAGLHHLLQAR